MSSKIKFLFPILLLLFTSILYLHNLSRSVYGGDVGDLVTASVVGGVAHPSGYPLFTLLGFILTRFNFVTPAFMVGLISVFSSSLAILFFYFLINHLTKSKLAALISSLILAFSYFFWFYAEIAEVFALNNLFVILLFYLAVVYSTSRKNKILLLLFFILGLSFTNHHTIVFIFPSLIIIILKPLLKVFKNLKIVLVSFLFFILGFSVYLYVPIASSFNPFVNWDQVKDFPSFLHLLLRKDYGTFNAGVFASPNFLQRLIILKTYFLDLITQLTPPVISLSLVGAIVLFLKKRLLFVSFFLGFILSGPVFISYAGFPLFGSFFVGIYERFFIISSIILLMFFPFGLLWTSKVIGKAVKRSFYPHLLQGVFIVIPILLFNYNFPKTNLSNIWIGDNLAYDFLSPLPKNSVLLLSGDTVLFNAWYLHYALNFRPDVQVVNLNGLAGDVYLERETKRFVKQYPQYKKDKDLIVAVIKDIAKNRPVFSYNGIQPKEGEKLTWIPYGLSFKLTSNDGASSKPKEMYLEETAKIWQKLHVPKKEDRKNLALGSLSISDIPSVYANASLATGNFFLSSYQDEDFAFTFYKKALDIDPNYAKTYEVLGAYYLSKKECEPSEKNLKRAIGLSPFDKLPYYFLYTVYKGCFKNNTMASEVVLNYKKVFGIDLLKEIGGILK